MKVIIIGGVAAGMSAASKLKRLNKDITIQVYEKGTDLSYGSCGMPYFLSDIIKEEKRLVARTKADFEQRGINVSLNHEVVQVKPKTKKVVVKNLTTGHLLEDHYDALVIATGTSAYQTNVPGSEDANLFYLSNLEDARKLKYALKGKKSACVIGGGYIGIEVAENLNHLGLEVHIVELQKQLLTVFDQDIASMAETRLLEKGVLVHKEEKLIAYETKENKTVVKTSKGSYLVDLVIEAIGVKPNTAFLKDTGMVMLKNGAIKVDHHMQTSIPDIYAAGDCASYYHRIKEQMVYVPLGTHANKTGRVIAENLAGNDVAFPGIVGSNILKIFDDAFAKTGIGIDEAKRLGLDYDFVDVTAKNQSGYYPGAKNIFIRLTYEKKTGILKGAQMVGEKGVSDRINIMALAITKELTASEFSALDLAYAPPFSPVWDPLQVACNQIKV